jgi:uracil-DNA glycosylase
MEEDFMDITSYQKKCFNEYKKDIGYPANYTYFYGNPINVLVPIEITTNKIMIVGAYPSAKFFRLNGINDVPLYDNDAPFSNEKYFDGTQTRCIPSGNELDKILNKIGVNRNDCWITDLVKLFLFKKGHIKKYNKLGKNDLIENRTRFIDYAKKSLKWLEYEITIAKPSIIITLGREVTSIVFNISENSATNYLDGSCRKKTVLDKEVNIISLPHPGNLMRNNNWTERFENTISLKAKREIMDIIN